jgi:predicted NACHT family NTPase
MPDNSEQDAAIEKAPKEKSEPSSLPSQLAELAIKVLKPGGVSVGGGYGLWLLFIEHKSSEAIASALIGFCFSYAGKLLEPIHQGNQRRLKRMGEVIDGSIDGGIDQLFAKVSRAEDTYLLCQALDCRDYKSDGMGKRNRIVTPMLEDVFVPLELDSGAVPAGFQGNRQAAKAFENFRQNQCIWDFLAEAQKNPAYRQLAIVAWGGSGKTTLLKHLAYMYGTKQHKRFKVPAMIPVLLPLRQYRQQIAQESPLSLPDLLMQYHIREMAEIDAGRDRLSKLPANWFRDMLTTGKVLVMFDGFDEIPENERFAFSQWITQQMRRFDRSVFILTSRPSAYREIFEDSGRVDSLRTKVWVRPLTAEQQTKFVNQWYLSQEKLDRAGRGTPEVQRDARRNAQNLLSQIHDPERPELADLAKNPLLLNLLATYHRSDPGVKLPQQRVELYQDICSLQLRKRPAARDITLLLSPESRQSVIQAIALEMMKQNLKLIEESKLIALLKDALQEQNHQGISARDFLRQIVDVSELMVKQGLEGYEFSHLSFQEFLAANQIRKTHQEGFLYDFLKDADMDGEDKSWWRQTILLYVAQVEDPTVLIEKAIEKGANNLAYTCYQETTRILKPAVQEKLKALQPKVSDSRYAKLEKLLDQGKWKEADQETYRLMITTVKKEEGQFFDHADLENFPCEDLLEIDRLWVEASDGHFGFSVQKKIWQVCGSPMEYNDDFRKLLKEVGWLRPKYSMDDSLMGELPVVRVGYEYCLLFVCCLFETCEL